LRSLDGTVMILRLKVACTDRKGVVSALAARLFDLGINLGDTGFTTLAEMAEFTAIAELPPGLKPNRLVGELERLPELDGAEIEATPIRPGKASADAINLTHRLTCLGPDQPGLLARLTEVLVGHDANIASLHATRFDARSGELFRIRLAVAIPPERAAGCLSALDNAAQALGQRLSVDTGGEPAAELPATRDAEAPR
jgi:glycine cleavage system transcriptional repressor